MKKLVLSFLFILSIFYCFAGGKKEKEQQLNEIKARMEARILENPNVESVKLYYLEHKDFAWEIFIILKNGGRICIESCTENDLLNNNICNIGMIGQYFTWDWLFFKETDKRVDFLSYKLIAYSALLNIPLNSIDDYINNYEKLLELVEKIAVQTPQDRSKRSNMFYKDSDFFNYAGNFETDEYYGMLFSKKLKDDFWANSN